MSPAAVVPALVVVGIVGVDSWVYADAKQRERGGRPVVFRAGSFAVDTPAMWFICCLVLWIVFFPLYITSRG